MGASICASCFCDASAYSRRMRVRSASCTHAYWKAGRGRVGIWHCAAYYPRMHEMPCHLQTGHARSTLSLLLRCWCCTLLSQLHSCMFRTCDRARSNSLVSCQMRQMHLFNNTFKQLSKIQIAISKILSGVANDACSLFLLLSKRIYRYRPRVNPFEQK